MTYTRIRQRRVANKSASIGAQENAFELPENKGR